jgi:signal transduction histidine kinase/CheY-like chemotaxis protein
LVVESLLLACGVLLLSRAGLLLALVPRGGGVPLWPAAGLSLAVLLLRGSALFGGVLVGSLAALLWAGNTVLPALALALANAGAAAVGASILRRLPGFTTRLETLRDAAAWIIVSALVGLLQAGSRALVLFPGSEPQGPSRLLLVLIWFLGNEMGVMVVGTAVLSWAAPRRPLRLQGTGRLVELIALLLSTALVAHVSFGGLHLLPQSAETSFVVVPFLVWGSLRFGLRGSSGVVLLVGALSILDTVAGLGPFADGPVTERVLVLQAFLAVSSGTGLVFAAASAERARAAFDVREALARYRALIDGLPDAFLRVSADGTLLDVVAHGSFFLRKHQPQSGQRLRDWLPAPAGTSLQGAVDAALKGSSSVLCTLQLPGESMQRDIECSVTPVSEDEAIVLARDVTETRKLQAQLLLSDRLASVGTLAAGVAHEINNPLAYVTANLELLEQLLERMAPASFEQLRKECHDLAEESVAGSKRIAGIVRDLRSFAARGAEEAGPLDLAGVLDDCIGLVSNELRHRARLTKEYQPIPQLFGNAATLGQVFLNLLINAAQAIPEGAADRNNVVVRLRPDPEGRGVLVEVRDSGVGIPPEHLGRIFDPFFTTKPVGVGTGLGLSICYRIISAAGGDISVESTPGRGTRVSVRLPLLQPTRAALAGEGERRARTGPLKSTSAPGVSGISPPGLSAFASSPAEPPLDNEPLTDTNGSSRPVVKGRYDPLRSNPFATQTSSPLQETMSAPPRRRVLVVDDEPLVARSVARALSSQMDVEVLHSVKEARAKVDGDPSWDALVCDLMMPDETGMDLHAYLEKAHPALAQRMVFMTGGAFTSAASDFLDRVKNPRVEKPFAPKALVETVRSVMI